MGRFIFVTSLTFASLAAFAEDQEICISRAKTEFANEIPNLEPMQIRDKAIELEKKLKECGVELQSVHNKKKDHPLEIQPIEITEEDEKRFYMQPITHSPVADTHDTPHPPHDGAAQKPHGRDLRACIDDAVQVRRDTRQSNIQIDDRAERRDARHARHDVFKAAVDACIHKFKDDKQAWKDARNDERDHPITTQPINPKDPPQGAFKIQPIEADKAPGRYRIQPIETDNDPGRYRIQPIVPVNFIDDGDD